MNSGLITMKSMHDIKLGDYLIIDKKTKNLKKARRNSRRNKIVGIALTDKDNFDIFLMEVLR